MPDRHTIARKAGSVAAAVAFYCILSWKAAAILGGGFDYNWDILGYVGCVVAVDETDPSKLHARTYAEVEREVPKAKWIELNKLRSYREKTAADPDLFVQQLPFYQGRWLYVGPIWMLSRLGVPTGHAVVWASVAAWILTASTVLFWLSRRLPVVVAAPVALGLSLSTEVVTTARSASSDGVFALLTILAGFVYVQLNRPFPAIAVLGVAMLARADAVLPALVLAAALVVVHGRTRESARFVAAAVSLVAAYLVLGALAGARSWWVVLHFTTLGMTPEIDHVPTQFDLGEYSEILGSSLERLWGSSLFLHLGLATAAIWAAVRRFGWVEPSRAGVFLAVVGVTEIGRFLLFPRDWPRLMAPMNLAIEVAIVVLLAELSSRPADSSPQSRS